MKKEETRTRIAPSPTGTFHIGTARTALFNYLFAQKNKGKFILRFEDTDQKRSKKEFEKDIIDGLEWLGLNHDEDLYFQSKDLDKYQKYANSLVQKGLAYKKDGAIWFNFKSIVESRESKILGYNDLIHSRIEFPAEKFNDFVIIKSDGLPSFMFGNIIDDHEEKITHVIRGEDHITNTPQQILIYRALGWEPPKYGHIPLILNKDRSKMSKRKDPVSITKDFRDQGYLPEAMINYMALLGWNPKTEEEFFTLKKLIEEFDLKNINKSAAIFDLEKLNYFNSHYIRTLSNKDLIKLISNFQFSIFNRISKDQDLDKIITIVKARMTKLTDFDELAKPFLKEIKYNSALLIFKKSTREATLRGLKAVSDQLSVISSEKWNQTEELNKTLLNIVQEEKLSNGDVFWPVRVALSGLERSPSPVEMLWALGRKQSLKRINKAIDILEGHKEKK